MQDEDLFLKHYEIQQTALNEIKEIIAVCYHLSAEEKLQAIEAVSAYASMVSLTNPNRLDDSKQFIRDLSYDPSYDILSQSKR